MNTVEESKMHWKPAESLKGEANIQSYIEELAEEGKCFENYEDLWHWSVTDLSGFWASIWDFFRVKCSRRFFEVIGERRMPGAQWFAGAELNYAEQVFRHVNSERPAILFRSETGTHKAISWSELLRQTGAIASALRSMGIKPGDRVVAYMPNIPETVVAFLACASIGAIWSSSSPDFGVQSTSDRFSQIEPKILFAVDGYRYNGKPFDKIPAILELQSRLPSLEKTVLVPYLNPELDIEAMAGTLSWNKLLSEVHELAFTQLPFNHPLWILYSSGTTGLPKAIVHSQGGIILEHLKALGFHLDLKSRDRFLWFTTTGWMMWNFQIGGLLLGCTIVLYDGSPSYPARDSIWEFVENAGVTIFGASSALLLSNMKDKLEVGSKFDLTNVRAIGSTGSPLPPEGFQWVYESVKADVWLTPISGGTDLCSAFVGGCPLLPVYAGQMQCRYLGAFVDALDDQGRKTNGAIGELVIKAPMPSMPLYFWNDVDNQRYLESYFSTYPGIWRHGDWIRITPQGGAIVYGRSDATLNRMGIRIGTSEIYRVVDELNELTDSVATEVFVTEGESRILLFVSLADGCVLDQELRDTINQRIRDTLSPRHVPDQILAVPMLPRTLNGKKLEIPLKKILMGTPIEQAVNLDSISNPESIGFFIDLATKLRSTRRRRSIAN